MEPLHRFKNLCRALLAEGIKPTPTVFAKRGWGYVCGGNVPRSMGHWNEDAKPNWVWVPDHEPKPPIDVPGSGVSWTSGKYTQARREVLQEAGWQFVPYKGKYKTSDEYRGRWVKEQ